MRNILKKMQFFSKNGVASSYLPLYNKSVLVVVVADVDALRYVSEEETAFCLY